MKLIPLVRAVHFCNHLKFLRGIGAPVERGLHQVKLPIRHIDQPESYLPLPKILAFLNLMRQSQGIDDFGLRALPYVKMANLSADFLGAACQAPTLFAALQAFCVMANHESSYVKFWMVTERARVRVRVRVFNSFTADCDMQGLRESEWLQNFSLVEIVRAFVGPQWVPTEMAFRSNAPLAQLAFELFPNTRFLIGQEAAWIDVPWSILSLSPRATVNTHISGVPPQAGSIELPLNFSETLKLLLKTYLGDGCPSINLAAEIADTSVRTLQRQLTGAGLTYSQLAQQVRLETAMQLLKDSNIRIKDAAFEVGYADPSNFTRAFRAFAGLSPQEFRRHHHR